MATEKLRAELEILTAKAEKDLARVDRSLAGVEKRVASIGGKGGKSLKPLGEGLSAATVNANEFEKSMAAANARVIAFGASAGLILQVQRALKETVRATIEVEKSLTDINVVLNTNTKGLQKFGDSLFKIAGQTGQGFKTVAVAATELARQGLSMEKTLLRTKDALILTRLTGMGAEEAVSSLTAAVNSFNKAGITSAQVVNKMAKVDQAFAVSSDDLAKAISRVGSSAVDAGVSMDELLAITTAVQQRTARGGAVIGNAFKTIFTRIGRTDVQKKLAGIGVATRDMQGQMLPATRVLENLSTKFQELSKSQQNQIAESVAGVFQVNILRAALGDLSSKYGVYNRALKESASATNEAYLKNQQLNQTLDALVNKTLANLTKAGAAIGGATLKPAIENVLGLVNSAIGAFGEGGRFEEFGKGIGKDIMKGIGNFIAGPGLVVVTAGIAKLAFSFAKFAGDALKGFADIGRQAANRKALEAQITAELQRQPNIIRQIERGELSAANAAKDMLAAMKASNLEATKLAVTTSRISASMMGMGALRRPGRAQGFIPNFADPNAERASAAMGGYKAGAIKTMNIPGQGSVMYNSAETVKRFPGMQQPAIMPPQGSRAGSNYQKAFGAAHGFDPYAAGGFVPNFNKMSVKQLFGLDRNAKIRDINVNEQRSKQLEDAAAAGKLRFDDYSDNPAIAAAVTRGKLRAQGAKTEQVGKNYTHNASYLGLLGLEGSHLGTSTTSLGKIARFADAGLDPRLLNRKVTFTNMQANSIDEITKGSTQVNKSKFSDLISEKMTTPVSQIANEIFKKGLGDDHKVAVADLQKQFKGNHQLLPPGAEGSIFEAAVNLGLLTTKKSPKARLDAFDQSTKGAQKPFDFEESGRAKPPFRDIFHFEDNLLYADAKRTIDNKSMGTLIKKAYNQGVPGLPGLELLEGGATVAKGAKKVKAFGHVPNFSPLGDAITRERAAGVPRSAIRVGASASLKSAGNPAGLGVYNTIDEPAGLHQGISRSRRMGVNPKAHGVPNFAKPFIDMPAGYVMPGASPVAESRTRIEGREGPKKINEGGTKIKKAADTMKAATDKLTGAGGLMALSSIGYMAAPALQRATGMDPRIMDTGMMALGGLGAAQMFLGSDAEGDSKRRGARESFSRSRRAAQLRATRAGATAGRGAGVMRGLKAAGASILGLPKGKVTPGGALKGLARRAALPVTAYAATAAYFKGANESEEERNFRLAQEALTKAQESDSRPILEQLGAGVSQFSGGFRTSSSKVRQQQFGDIRNMVYGKGGLMEGADTETSNIVGEAFSEFTNSFTRGALAVESAGEKFNKAIADVADNLSDRMRELENRQLITGIQKDFADPKLESKPIPGFTQVLKRGKFVDAGPDGAPEGARTREFFFEGAANVKRRGKDLAERIMGMAASPDEIFRNILAAEQQHGGTLEQNLQRIDLFDDPTYKKVDRGVFGGLFGADHKAGRANDPNLKAGRFGLAMLGISPKIQDQLNVIDPETLKAAEDELLKMFQKGGRFGPGANRAFRAGGDLKGVSVAGVDTFMERSDAMSASTAIQIEKRRTAMLISDLKISQKTNLLRRQHQDALIASTRGIYAESDIKLREAKLQNKIAHDIEAEDIKSRIEIAKQQQRESAAGIVADAIRKSPSQASDLRGARFDIGGMDILAARDDLIDTQRKLDNPFELSPEQKNLLEVRKKLLALRIKTLGVLETENALTIENAQKLTAANQNADKQNEIDRQIIENKYKYNRVLDMEIKQKELQLQVDKNRFLRTDLLTGRITGQQFASGRARERSMRRDAEGMAGQPMVGFGTIMQERFAYGPRNAAEDFEQGMADVADTIKGGMKDSIKGLISGAEDFKSALRNVMDKLLDKTLDTGLEVVVGNLFGKLGNFAGRAGGGGFGFGGFLNQGGIVRGGSGVKDDVMTFMQGGEYVIKKSAAQKIGYGTLNAINSYSSGGKARVSLAKDFMYTGDDPTRPTGGGFKVSRGLSTRALFRDDDPQTGRVFGRQQKLASYLEYRRAEQARRDAAVQRVKDQKSARLRKAYIGAAINIGAGAIMQRMQTNAIIDKGVSDATTGAVPIGSPAGIGVNFNNMSARGGSPALVQGGEYIMSPRTTAKYGTGFMAELNRGRMPGFNMGGLVGGGGGAGGGITTNNVNLAINVDKSGQTSVQTEQTSGGGKDKEREDKSEIERQKKMGEAIRGVVLKEIERQQRPGGLLRDNASYSGGRRI